MSRKLFNLWNGYQMLYFGITWFSESVQAGISAAEHKSWIKKNVNLLKKTYYMYRKTLEHGLNT